MEPTLQLPTARLCLCGCLQVLAENQALVEFKKQVVGLKKVQDADFVAKQKQALAVSPQQHPATAADRCAGSTKADQRRSAAATTLDNNKPASEDCSCATAVLCLVLSICACRLQRQLKQ